MALDRRRPPVFAGRPSEEIVSAAGIDTFRDTPNSPKLQARRRDFARAMVFEEFKYKHARAIAYDRFRDRKPNQAPRPSPELRRMVSGWSTSTSWWSVKRRSWERYPGGPMAWPWVLTGFASAGGVYRWDFARFLLEQWPGPFSG